MQVLGDPRFSAPHESLQFSGHGWSAYLLVVFGGGVLLLSVQSGEPRLSPRVRAGAAHRFVRGALPTRVVPESKTFSKHCYSNFSSLTHFCNIRGDYKQCSLPWQSFMLKQQRGNHVSLITQQHHHSMATTQREKKCSVAVRSRFICLIRANRGPGKWSIFPVWEKQRTKNFQVNYRSVPRRGRTPRGKKCTQEWDIIHPNTAPTGFARVKPPWWARLIF